MKPPQAKLTVEHLTVGSLTLEELEVSGSAEHVTQVLHALLVYGADEEDVETEGLDEDEGADGAERAARE